MQVVLHFLFPLGGKVDQHAPTSQPMQKEATKGVCRQTGNMAQKNRLKLLQELAETIIEEDR